MLNKIVLLAFVSLNFISIAQENIVVVDRKREKKEFKIVDNTYVIKFSPLQIIPGEINFGLEYVVNDMSSLDIEIGPTLSNLGVTVNDSHVDPWGNTTGNTSRAGFFMGLGYRFYPMDNARVLNRLYISPVFKYRLFNYGIIDYSNTLEEAKGSENQMLFTFNVGHQWWLSDHFSIDFFGGIGIAYEVHNDKYMETLYNPDTQMYDYRWADNKFSGARFAGTVGLKFGIGY
ncbi:MAG: DUF3575 domain-containing protein [Bacteroidota bacterium]